MGNLFKALKGFFLILSGKGEFPVSAPEIKTTAKPEELQEKAPAVSDTKKIFEAGAVYSLVLLQREGRLIDFLKEDITAYSDEQVGAAVRQIHASCAKIMNENFGIRHLFATQEGSSFTVKDNFEADLFTLTGDVPAKFPADGTLQHAGWSAAEIKLPSRNADANPSLVYRAEISF